MNLDVYADGGGHINNDTPIYEYDELTTTDVTYIRWENSTEDIFMKKVDNSGSTVVITYTKDAWLNRVTATWLGYHEYKAQ